MALDDQRDFSSFGWSVSCRGLKAPSVREDVRKMVDWAVERCASYFPREQGYEVAAQSPAGPSNGVRVSIRRGDFLATMSVESILNPSRRSPDELAIRTYGRAESEALAAADRAGHRRIRRYRATGVAGGLLLFFASLWFAFGQHAPIFVLGGLLMVVAALLTTTLGASFGGWIGERIAESERIKALAELRADPRLQDDLRRWRAFSRQLSAQRLALTGRQGATPFRALPAATTPRTPSRPLPRLAPTSSFSFSS